MDAVDLLDRGQSFLVQYQLSSSRGELRNIAVVLVAESGGFAAVKHLPPSLLAGRVREQGILDAALVSLADVVSRQPEEALARLDRLRRRREGTLVIGDPMPTDMAGSPERALAATFKALVTRPTARRAGYGKAEILDRAVSTLRGVGATVRVGEYLDDFLIDALIVQARDNPPAIIHAQTFDGARRDWSRLEQETAHFLFASEQIRGEAICVVQPPTERNGVEAGARSYSRVERWIADAGAAMIGPSAVASVAARFGTDHQLPLVMAG